MILSVYAKAYRGDVRARLAAAAADGFEGVELRGDVDGTPLTAVDPDAFRDLCGFAADLGVQVVTLALGAVGNLSGNLPGLRRVGELAGIAGARVRLFSSNRPGVRQPHEAWGDPPEDDFRREADDLAMCTDAVVSAWPGVQVMLEAEPISIANTISRQARLIATAGVSVGFNWDFVNCWMGGEYPWPEPWSWLEGRLLGVHFKAAKANPLEPARYASQAIPPADDLPHRAMWATWAASGFCGPVTVDPHYGLIAPADRFDPEPEQPDTELCRCSLAVMQELRHQALERVA